jgi:hypothetical protein
MCGRAKKRKRRSKRKRKKSGAYAILSANRDVLLNESRGQLFSAAACLSLWKGNRSLGGKTPMIVAIATHRRA